MPQAFDRLVYVSPVPLGSFAQRPHHFVHWFHEQTGAPVLWIDPGPSRLPRWSDWRRLRRWLQGSAPSLGPTWQHEPWVQHCKARVLPFEPYSWGRRINQLLWKPLLQQVDDFVTTNTLLAFGKPCALSLALAQRYPQLHQLFDAMDHMPGFCTGASRRWMLHAEQALAAQVHTIWASSNALLDLHQAHAHKSQLVLNAMTPPPKHLKRAPNPQPVFGYLGVIDHWFDWPLVIDLAQKHPWLQVELVGPMHCPPPRPLPTNLRCKPAVPQHQVYEAMAQFDVGIIPFKLNELTAYVDPVKYYEYLGLGLPVLSTPFGQIALRTPEDGVFVWTKEFIKNDINLLVFLSKKTNFPNSNQMTFLTWSARFDNSCLFRRC